MKILVEFETDEEHGKVDPKKFLEEIADAVDIDSENDFPEGTEFMKVIRTRLVKVTR